MRVAVLTMLAFWTCVLASNDDAQGQVIYDVDVTLTNDHDKDFVNLPVFLQVFRVFGRGVDYTKFNSNGFHVYNDQAQELEYTIRPVPPDFSLANDEIVIVFPQFTRNQSVNLRFVNTTENSVKKLAYNPANLVTNQNNLIPNGGFENGVSGWTGGTIVNDVVRSGTNALLLQVAGSGGAASLSCSSTLPFTKDKNYYFGIWAKCENVVRRTWRYHMPWALTPISGRITFSGDPLVFPEYDANYDVNHLIRLMDDRDWYCYEANALSTMCIPKPAINTCQSTLTLTLNQESMPYLDSGKPAKIWLDEALLFEQPAVQVSWSRIQAVLTPGPRFLYRRAPTCLNMELSSDPVEQRKTLLDPPRPYEKVTAISDAALRGERKTLTLGINTTQSIQNLYLDISNLSGPSGAVLGASQRDVEFNYTPTVNFTSDGTGLEGWVLDGNPARNINRPGFVDYLIGYRIPTNATPGTYTGTVTVKGDGGDLGAVPVELEVMDYPLNVVTDRFAGLIWNAGCGPEKPGVSAPWRNTAYFNYFSRCNFTYLMLFGQFLPFIGSSDDVDASQLLTLMQEIRDVAGCSAGLGLYPDCSLDKQGNPSGPDGGTGLWPRSGNNQDTYRAHVNQMDTALAAAGLPRLMYMIWDEPRFCDPGAFGILKNTGAFSTSDINYTEACQSMQQGLFTHTAIDGPGCDYGPMMRKYANQCGVKVGWDTQYGPFLNRYQTGLMLANGGSIISCWHSAYYIVYHDLHQTYARSQPLVGVGEGMIDFKYFATLKDTIAWAKGAGVMSNEVQAAEAYLAQILGFCTDDFHFMSMSEIFTYNGGPERWGDDWFYDQWRSEMRRHILEIRGIGNQSPVARITASSTNGLCPLEVDFSGSTSTDSDGVIVSYAWNFGDGATSANMNVTHTYSSAGTFIPTLTVTDDGGATNTASTTIAAAPWIVSVTSSDNPNLVEVTFGGPVDETTAENPANYQINNLVTVSGAVLQGDGKTAALTTTTLRENVDYGLTVTGVKSQSGLKEVPYGTSAVFQYSDLRPGVNYDYYEGSWTVLPDFNALTPVKSGVTNNFTLAPTNRPDNFAFRYRARLNITTGGDYTFYTYSDDGSRLYVDGGMVVDNDGSHSPAEQSGPKTLTAGLHDIMVTFFEGSIGEVLEVRWQGPSIAYALIPNSVLYQSGSSGPVDGDSDGIVDNWEVIHFGNTNAVSNSLLQDSDSDGLCDYYEYLAGTDPHSGSSVFAVLNLVPGISSGWALTWRSVPGKFYQVDAASNLNDGFVVPLGGGIPATPPTNTMTVPVQGDRSFYKIRLDE